MDLLALAEQLKGRADEVSEDLLSRWARIRDAEPWHALPDHLDHDHLPELIRRLAAAALATEYDRGLCLEVVDCAAQHGAYRAGESLEESLIYREYHLLRRALYEHLAEEHGPGAVAHYAAMRLDTLISLATAASVQGWHRDQLEAEGRWPEARDELLASWPLPDPD